jgi:hypothetical protein
MGKDVSYLLALENGKSKLLLRVYSSGNFEVVKKAASY